MTTPIDLTKPASTDLYTAWPTEIQSNMNGLAFGLDGTYISSYAGLAAGVKRTNSSTGLIEQWNGSAWAAWASGYILKAGDTFTGALGFNNNVPIDWKDVGGTFRRGALLTSANNFVFGDVDNAITGASTYLAANGTGTAYVQVGGATIAYFNSANASFNKLTTITPGGAEALRMINDGAYLSGWNSANSTRTGYVSFNAGVGVNIGAENGAILAFAVGGSERARIDTAGNMGVGVTPSAWGGSYKGIQFQGGSLMYSGGGPYLTQNLYNDGTNWRYNAAGYGTVFLLSNSNGAQWFNAPSGAAGAVATLTQNMGLDANGTFSVTNAVSSIATFNSTFASGGWTSFSSSGAIYGYIGAGIGLVATAPVAPALSDFAIRASSNLLFSINSTEKARFAANGLMMSCAASTIPVSGISSGTALTFDARGSNVYEVTMTGNVPSGSISIPNPTNGQTINVFLTQDATGGRTLGFSTASFKWPGGVAGTLSTTAGAVDLLVMTYRAATGFWYCTLAKAFA